VRVAIIVSDVNIFDGVNRVGADLITMLKTYGHDVALCSWNQPADETFEEFREVEHFYAASPLFNRVKGRLIRSLLLSRSSIKKCLKDFNPDVFVGTGSEPAVFSFVPNDKVKIQYVHFPTEFFMEIRSSLIHLLYRTLYWHYHYQQLPRIDAVICNSNYTREITYLIWGKVVQEERLKVIHPAIDLKRFEREQLKRKNQICYVGRLSKGKGVEHAIKAFMQIYPEYDLKMVLAGGPGKDLQLRLYWEIKLKPYIESLISNGASIELKIDPSYQTVINTFLESKAMVSYSRYEHFGIVPLESQAAGCPPIVANSGGQRETVEHGKTGFRADNPEELSKYLRLLLDNQKQWKRMSENGRLKAKNYSFNKIGSQWQNLLEQLNALYKKN
jgi:glycosyltransferase involved in cell wall biosynthesis